MRVGVGSESRRIPVRVRPWPSTRRGLGHEVRDFGTASEEAVDYPDLIRPLALRWPRATPSAASCSGGPGNGEAMAANRVPGVRCAVSWDEESARLSRAHNDANVLSIGQRLVPEPSLLADRRRAWLRTPFEGGRHVPADPQARRSPTVAAARERATRRGSPRGDRPRGSPVEAAEATGGSPSAGPPASPTRPGGGSPRPPWRPRAGRRPRG